MTIEMQQIGPKAKENFRNNSRKWIDSSCRTIFVEFKDV
jgi:hypothetical protein